MQTQAVNSLQQRKQLSAAVASLIEDTSSLRAQIMPLNEDGQYGPAQQVSLKHYDQRGLKFEHEQPFRSRHALVVLEDRELGRITAEVDLSWCRFSRDGKYTTGGRFVQLIGQSA